MEIHMTCISLCAFRYEVEGCEVIWAIKDTSISSTFVDVGAAQFFLPHLSEEKKEASVTVKRQKYTLEQGNSGLVMLLHCLTGTIAQRRRPN